MSLSYQFSLVRYPAKYRVSTEYCIYHISFFLAWYKLYSFLRCAHILFISYWATIKSRLL